MSSQPDSLVVDMVRGIRGDLAEQRTILKEHSLRLTEIAASVASLRRDQALDAESNAHLAARFDRLRDRVERIERRLDIID